MIKGLIGKKIGMTQIFDQEGNLIPVTLVEAGPCTILELKDSPSKIKLGFENLKESKAKKPSAGFFKKVGVAPMRFVKEFGSSDNAEYTVGQELKVDLFKRGDAVDVTAVSIGKGFQGGMKRWHWAGGPGGHGSNHHRRVGSIGASADPSRTLKGTNMPGQMGNKKTTVQGLRVMDIDQEHNLLIIKGAIPGHKNSLVSVRFALKKKYRDLDAEVEVHHHKVNPMKKSKKGKKA